MTETEDSRPAASPADAGASDDHQARLQDLLDELVATGERAEMKSRIAELLDSVDQAVRKSGLPQELALAVLASDVYTRLEVFDSDPPPDAE